MTKIHTAQAGFAQFDLSPEIQKGIESVGFTEPSPIQVETIPLILKGRDVIAQAQTGTGKTAAFGLPLMSRLFPCEGTAILVIAPTRELAVQVADELYTLGKFAGAQVAAVYGGASARDQIMKVKKGANIITGTPGRLLDLLSSGRIKMKPTAVVLDEADRMLDMGFLEDIEKIFTFLPEERQTLLFSATLPERIKKLAEKILNNPARIKTESTETAARIKQKYYVLNDQEREPALVRLIDAFPPERAIIFCKTKRETDELSVRLNARGVQTRAIHGDMEQHKREQVLRAFRAGQCRILVATDVAARGLDVQGITHVFNYHIPFDAESYTHRIGRTGRAGMEGLAVTFVSPGEMRTWRRMLREAGGRAEFSQVPTTAQLKESRRAELIAKIEGMEPDPSNGRMLEKLTEKMDVRDVALRLLAMVQENVQAEGADKIGMSAQEAEQLGRDSGRKFEKRRPGNFGPRKGPPHRGAGERSSHSGARSSERSHHSARPAGGPAHKTGASHARPAHGSAGHVRPKKKSKSHTH